jgi:hypothetical protein
MGRETERGSMSAANKAVPRIAGSRPDCCAGNAAFASWKARKGL